MSEQSFSEFCGLAINDPDDFVFGRSPKALECGKGLRLGAGTVFPEINFTLPAIEINDVSWPEIRRQYAEMIDSVCRRAVDLDVPGLLVEFEPLPPMTIRPSWGAEITQQLAETLGNFHEKFGLKCALRLTPNDTRDHQRPPLMRRGSFLEQMRELFKLAAGAGADLLAIESTGGKEVSDPALTAGDLRQIVFALGSLAARDVQFLWREIVEACAQSGIIPSGDSACGFSNTAMVLAEQRLIPRVLAAVVRVATVPRSLVAYKMGARGPSKDCAYEGPYIKAICGVPISMEGRSAACAHLSPIGNIAQAVCDCWSNESVQNVRLLSANAPVVSMEQLAYDCRLLNAATAQSAQDALRLRNWLVESDSALDPQAYVLRPEVVLRISRQILQEPTPYRQTRLAVLVALEEIRHANKTGQLRIHKRELAWLDRLQAQADALPENEEELIAEMWPSADPPLFLPEEYGLTR